MRKKLVSFWLFFLPLILQAQVTVNVVLPPAGMVQKDQLWNLALVNNLSTEMDVYMLLELQDAVTGQSVLSAGTRILLLPKGIKMLQPRDVQPVQYNNMATGFDGNFLPLGSYIACYTVRRTHGATTVPIATECVRLNISPLSPPLLNTPADKTVLQTPYPQFTWTPPAPLNLFDNLSYDVNVAEIMPGQSPAEAILYNTPKYVSGRQKPPYANYPSTYSKLEPGKTYAWQVTARNGLSYAAATEPWAFTIAGDSAKIDLTTASYVQLSNNSEESGINYLTGDQLHVKYYSFDKSGETIVRLIGSDKKTLQEVKQQLVYGDNFFTLKLSKRFHKGEIYQIEITDIKKTVYTAAFSIK